MEHAAYEEETHPTDHFRERFVSLAGDKLVGLLILSTCNWLDGDRTFGIHIFVHPEHRSHGRRLYRLTETHLGYLNWRRLMADCRESNEAATTWLARLEFREVGRNLDSILDLSTYRRPADYNEVLQRVTDQGIEIRTYAEIEDPKRERKLWELYEEINADMPSPHLYRRSSFELWGARMANPAHHRGCDLARPRRREFRRYYRAAFQERSYGNATLPINRTLQAVPKPGDSRRV